MNRDDEKFSAANYSLADIYFYMEMGKGSMINHSARKPHQQNHSDYRTIIKDPSAVGETVCVRACVRLPLCGCVVVTKPRTR